MNITHMHTGVSDPAVWTNAVTQQIAITVTPLDPAKCYFIVIRDNDETFKPWQLSRLQEMLTAHGIKCVVVQLPDSVEIECIAQEAANG